MLIGGAGPPAFLHLLKRKSATMNRPLRSVYTRGDEHAARERISCGP